MSQMYRVALCSGVAMAALALSAPAASAQTSVLQSTNNSAAVSNPAAGTNTIDLGGGGLGTGASVSTSAGGAVSSTSITGINSHFVNPGTPPASGFTQVIQGAINQTTAPISNTGAIINASGDAALGSSLGISARGAASTLSVIGMGGIPFQAINFVGDIGQGVLLVGGPGPVVGALGVINDAPVTNTGEISGPSGGPAINLSGTGASASVSATGALSAVSWTALDAAGFTSTSFNNIQQAPRNTNTGGGPVGVSNTLSANGISLGAISGDGASVSATATGAAAAVSFSTVNTANWSGASLGSIIIQQPSNTATVVNNGGVAGISVGTISGDGASVRLGATGATAGISFSTIGSTFIGGPPGINLNGGFNQLVQNNGSVSNSGTITSSGTSGLTGLGSSAVVSAVGGSAGFSWSSIGDTLSPVSAPFVIGPPFMTQQVINTSGASNVGGITLGSGNLANGAVAALSATGAQASVSVNSINTGTFTTPFLGNINQSVTSTPAPGADVTNSITALTTGNLSGHGSSVSTTATGAAASIGVSFINTTAWSGAGIGSAIQSATSSGIVNNLALSNPISVGAISGTGASVRASAAGAVTSIAMTSILSGTPDVPFNTGLVVGSPILQTATNTGLVRNEASIVSTGTLSGMASSAVISATGAAASVSVASINDTTLAPFTVSTGTINQTVTNNLGSVTNLGSITLVGGNLGAGAAASISAVGASASVSFLAIR
jgi:hypothetical protein